MGEIKFNVTRMTEVQGRLDEIANQLTSSKSANTEALNAIKQEITGEEVKTIITSYVEKNDEVVMKTEKLIKELSTYLQGQINKYSTTEQAAAETLTDVKSILAGLE